MNWRQKTPEMRQLAKKLFYSCQANSGEKRQLSTIILFISSK
jgi:hypothetical protein